MESLFDHLQALGNELVALSESNNMLRELANSSLENIKSSLSAKARNGQQPDEQTGVPQYTTDAYGFNSFVFDILPPSTYVAPPSLFQGNNFDIGLQAPVLGNPFDDPFTYSTCNIPFLHHMKE